MWEPLAIVDLMYLEGLELRRQQFRRQHPEADEDAIEAMVRQWISDRPMDAPGRVIHP